MRRSSELAAPMAFQGGRRQTRSVDQDYRNMLATKLAALGLTVDQAGRIQRLQQAMDYEQVAGAKSRYGVDRDRAASAGGGALLASQLVRAGGQALGGAYMSGAFRGDPRLDPDLGRTDIRRPGVA
jgi:hypothetical protein